MSRNAIIRYCEIRYDSAIRSAGSQGISSELTIQNVRMSTDEKIRLGILALSAVSAVVLASHMGHIAVRPPWLDDLGGQGSGP